MKKRILVIDDEVAIAYAAERILEKMGYEVSKAENGKDAKKEISSGRFDLMVTDLRLPDSDGIDLIRTFREKFPSAKVITMTGYPTLESARKAAALGASQYLSKPFDKSEFERAVTHSLDENVEKSLRDKPVLIVEDSASFLQTLTALFNARGIKTLTATNAEQALKNLSKANLVVSSVYLPDMTGIELCRRAKETSEGKNKVFVLMSGQRPVEERMEEEAKEAGADLLMAKPADPYDLCLKVEEFLKKIKA